MAVRDSQESCSLPGEVPDRQCQSPERGDGWAQIAEQICLLEGVVGGEGHSREGTSICKRTQKLDVQLTYENSVKHTKF
jgi:hypothetical protein